MANDHAEELTQRPAAEVLRDTDRTSVGVVRILSSAAGKPGEEREYKTGDEALVEGGQAEWVVAPVHSPASGRRMDADAERGATPLGGAEVYPPAEPTTSGRRSAARADGYVDAHTDDKAAGTIAAKRSEVASSTDAESVKTDAALGGLGARSGPVTAQSDLPADKARADADKAAADAAAKKK
jgi:hypothetical protein